MNSKRSYLDSLNAGRQRRPYASLEQLNRSLDTLEQRIDRNREETADHARAPRRAAGYETDMRAPVRQRATERNSIYDQPYQSIARDIERVRGQEEGVAAFGKIAGEIKSLREELRQQMTSGVKREFETLRKDIERTYAAGTGKAAGKLGVEFERLSGAIQSLAERGDDRNINMMRLEIEQLKQALDTLAREETVLSVDRRWDDLDRRFNDFEDRVSADVKQRPSDPAMAALTKRVEQISEAVTGLPDSLSLNSLEEKVRTLAGALDHFIAQQGGRTSETFAQIEDRLDEISRAIVATTVAAQTPHIDPEPFERIEARITALARQIEEVAEDRPTIEIMDRLNLLSERVDDIGIRSAMPGQAIERLASQIALIADKIDRAPSVPDTGDIFSGIEQRFDVLSGMIERRQGDALEQGNVLFRELERRLDEVADRIDQRQADAALDGSNIMGVIDQRFSALAQRLEAPRANPAAEAAIRELQARLEDISDRIEQRQAEAALDGNNIMGVIDQRFSALAQRLETPRPNPVAEAAIRGLEARLEDISVRLDQSASQYAGIDPELIRNLESQVSGLTAHLSRPNAPLPDFEDIGPRLDEIERSIAGSRESVLEAARHAAETAARSLAGSQAESAAVSGLAQDLRALETLTRRSDERNSKTFEAIHDTLLKIVDRLGSLENEPAPQQAAMHPPEPASRKMTLRDAPSIDGESTLALSPIAAEPVAPPSPRTSVERSPAQAAAAAAVAALDKDRGTAAEAEQGGRVRTMLGGLTRAFSGKKDAALPALAGSPAPDAKADAAPSVDLDAPLDPKLANRPLEPGSGAPDLTAIMKRVRDERGQPVKHSESDAAKSDFIAAARRAAQAAAAEAEVLKRKSDIGGPVKALRLGDILKSRRKPILMAAAAIMIALAGLQLGKAFMAESEETAAYEAPAIVAEQQLDTAALGSTSASSDNILAMEEPAGTVEPANPVRLVEPEDTMAAAEQDMPEGIDQTASTAADAPLADPMITADATAPAELPAAPEETVVAAAPIAQEAMAPVPPSAIEVPAEAGPLPLREAAGAGDAKALFEVASRYAEGRGIATDMAAAAKWYEKSAELGFAPAQFRIGNFYEKGLGVTRDVGKAKTWYMASAEKGNASAMHNLAVLYAMGADGATDNDAAAKWFIAAAELGVKDSQFNLGILSAKGVGMPQSLEESYKWFALVAKTGDKDAADKRDEIANSLRPEQLEKARAATELWKPKPLDPEANAVEIPDSWQETQDKTASIDMKKAVQNIQLILNKNGYEAGNPDGVMGSKTKNAIIAFQKDNGMDATGVVDEKLVGELLKRK